MNLHGYVEDAEHFKVPRSDVQKIATDAPCILLKDAIVRSRIRKDRRSQKLLDEVEAIAKLFDYSIETNASKTPSDIARDHRARIRKGQGGNLIQIYLAWLCCYHPAEARKLYEEVGLPFRSYEAEPPLPRGTELQVLSGSLPRNFSSIDTLRDFFSDTVSGVLEEIASRDVPSNRKFQTYVVAALVAIATFATVLISVNLYGFSLIEGWFEEQAVDWPRERISSYPLNAQIGILRQEVSSEDQDHSRLADMTATLSLLNLHLRREDALREAQEAVVVNPNDVSVWTRLAVVRAIAGNNAGAQEAIDQAKALPEAGADDDLAVVSEHLWIFQARNLSSDEISKVNKDAVWRSLLRVDDPHLRHILLMNYALGFRIQFDDTFFYDRLKQMTNNCTQHLMQMYRPMCRLIGAIQLARRGPYPEAEKTLQAISEDARTAGILLLASYADSVRGLVLAEDLGRVQEGLDSAQQAVDEARVVGDETVIFHNLNNLASIQNRAAQDPDSALASLREAYDITQTPSLKMLRTGEFLYFYANLESERGDADRAVHIYEEASDQFGENSPAEIRSKAKLLRSFGWALTKVGRRDEGDDKYLQAEKILSDYVDSLKPQLEITREQAPWNRPIFETRFREKLNFSLTSQYGLAERILNAQLQELRGLSDDLRKLYRPYYARLRADRLENFIDCHQEGLASEYQGGPDELYKLLLEEIAFLSDALSEYDATGRVDAPVGMKAHAISSSQVENLTARVHQEFGDPSLAAAYWWETWQRELSEFVSKYNEHADQPLEIPDFDDAGENRELLGPLYVALLFQKVDWHAVPTFGSWLRYLGDTDSHIIDFKSADAILISSLFLQRAADKRMLYGLTADYLADSIDLQTELMSRSDKGDETARTLLPIVVPNYLTQSVEIIYWIDGTKGSNRRRGKKVHLDRLIAAMSSAKLRENYETVLELLGKYQQLHEAIIGPCPQCGSWRSNIKEADFTEAWDTLPE